LSCLVLSCLVLPCLALSCLVLSCLVLSCLVLSRGGLSRLAWGCISICGRRACYSVRIYFVRVKRRRHVRQLENAEKFLRSTNQICNTSLCVVCCVLCVVCCVLCVVCCVLCVVCCVLCVLCLCCVVLCCVSVVLCCVVSSFVFYFCPSLHPSCVPRARLGLGLRVKC
jgi:hypothetical protein